MSDGTECMSDRPPPPPAHRPAAKLGVTPGDGGVMDRLNGRRVDELSTMLGAINVRSAVYCLSDFAAPWGFEVERSPVAKFHVVLRGAAVLTYGDAPGTLPSAALPQLQRGECTHLKGCTHST